MNRYQRTVIGMRSVLKDVALLRIFPTYWALRRRLGLTIGRHGPEKVAVVLQSYRRPINIEPILQNLLACDFVSTVVVSNNNPEVDLASYVRVRDPRLE